MDGLRKIKYDIRLIEKDEALEMVKTYHYSNILPKLNKYFVGFYIEDELVGLVTLGWGTRPKHTIQKLFPSLDTKDYFEIGRMCMTEDMPKNSESQMLSQLIKWVKINLPEVKVIFTWADGMLGKCGYVYQASNFIYAGFITTDIYIRDGVKIHPRQTKALFGLVNDKRKTVRPTIEQMKEFNINHYRGKQYKYLLFTCSKKEKRELEKECLCELNYKYPKESDLKWSVKDLETKKWVSCGSLPYKSDAQFKEKIHI